MDPQALKPQRALKICLGAGEYGCWQCEILPESLDPADPEQTPDFLFVIARSLSEITDNIPGVQTAIFLGRGTCIADPLTPGVQESLTKEVADAETVKCPYCDHEADRQLFTKPAGVANDLVVCPACKMLLGPGRLKRVDSP